MSKIKISQIYNKWKLLRGKKRMADLWFQFCIVYFSLYFRSKL